MNIFLHISLNMFWVLLFSVVMNDTMVHFFKAHYCSQHMLKLIDKEKTQIMR